MAKKPAMKKDKEIVPKDKESGLTAAQKKLPPALQAAIVKKMKKK